MARLARVVAPGWPHHVAQRGNRRQKVFFSRGEYAAYVELTAEWCRRRGVEVWAYCLMPNQPASPRLRRPMRAPGRRAVDGGGSAAGHRRGPPALHAADQLPRGLARAAAFARGFGRPGLWQGRFASFVMDEPYLLSATRYVERNPVRARLARRPEDWPYSSAAAHVAGQGDGLAEGDWLRELTAGWVCTWGQWIAKPDDAAVGKRFTRHEATGRPLDERPLPARLTALLGPDLVPQEARPKAETKGEAGMASPDRRPAAARPGPSRGTRPAGAPSARRGPRGRGSTV